MVTNNDYLTWNTEKYIFNDENDLNKILALDVEYEKYDSEWFSLSTVRAFSSGKELLEYYFSESFPRLISWSFSKYNFPDDMKITMEKLLQELTPIYGKNDKNIIRLLNIFVIFKDYLNREKFSLTDLKKFRHDISQIGLNFGNTKFELPYIGNSSGLIEIAFEQGAFFVDEDGTGNPEVELIKYLIDSE